MPSISLTSPVSGQNITAGLHATNYAALQALLNGGLDDANIAPAAGLSISKLQGYPADGAKVLKGDGTWATVSVGYGTALPGSPVDGQEFVLVDSTSAPTYQWRFRYNAGSASTFKWEFVGGVSAHSQVDTREGGAGAAYANLATVGPSFTLPYGGDYLIEIGAEVDANGAAAGNDFYMSYAIGGTAAVDADAIHYSNLDNLSATQRMYAVSRSSKKVGLTAVAIITKYKASSSGAWAKRWLKITPIRVG